MENEALKRVATLLNSFNNTFEFNSNVVGNEEAEVTIKNIKNNGAELIGILHDTFNSIVEATSKDHEVTYIEGKGLVIVKKVVQYVVEDFN